MAELLVSKCETFNYNIRTYKQKQGVKHFFVFMEIQKKP